MLLCFWDASQKHNSIAFHKADTLLETQIPMWRSITNSMKLSSNLLI